jgi:site-specific DNA-methyltransferase (adenine-specific)
MRARDDDLWTAVEFPYTTAGVEIRCEDARSHYPGDEADLAVFSPPYNCGTGYDDDPTGDRLPADDWQELVSRTMKVLRDGWQVGRVVVNVPAALNRSPYQPITLPRVQGLDLEAVIVWDKGPAVVAARTSWGSFRRSSAPAIRDRTERIYVFRTEHGLRGEEDALVAIDGRRYSPLLPAERFTELTQDLWTISPDSATRVGHPAPFPVQLARDVICLYGWPGCTVVDPFAGSGTTGVAAVQLGCQAVLIDQSETYCQLAARRIAEVTG